MGALFLLILYWSCWVCAKVHLEVSGAYTNLTKHQLQNDWGWSTGAKLGVYVARVFKVSAFMRHTPKERLESPAAAPVAWSDWLWWLMAWRPGKLFQKFFGFAAQPLRKSLLRHATTAFAVLWRLDRFLNPVSLDGDADGDSYSQVPKPNFRRQSNGRVDFFLQYGIVNAALELVRAAWDCPQSKPRSHLTTVNALGLRATRHSGWELE